MSLSVDYFRRAYEIAEDQRKQAVEEVEKQRLLKIKRDTVLLKDYILGEMKIKLRFPFYYPFGKLDQELYLPTVQLLRDNGWKVECFHFAHSIMIHLPDEVENLKKINETQQSSLTSPPEYSSVVFSHQPIITDVSPPPAYVKTETETHCFCTCM